MTNTNESRKEYQAAYRQTNKELLAEKRRVKNQRLLGTQARVPTRKFFIGTKKATPGVVITNGPITVTFD